MAKRIKAVWIEIHVHPSAIEENHSFPVFVRHRSCRGDCILYAGSGAVRLRVRLDRNDFGFDDLGTAQIRTE